MSLSGSAQMRDVTPPPRRLVVETPEPRGKVFSAQSGRNDWTRSPLSPPRNVGQASIVGKPDDLPLKIHEESCFSSPKPARGGMTDMNGLDADLALFTSPDTWQADAAGKENWQPGQGFLCAEALRSSPVKTPSRLPTVQEHDAPTLAGRSPGWQEHGEPAWLVRSPEPAAREEFGNVVKGLHLSPKPPGLEDVHCHLPKPTIKSTFIQFVSPLKTRHHCSPPKTEPWNLAPTASSAVFSSSYFDEAVLAMSHSPCPWETHEQIPFFPAGAAPPMPPPFNAAEIDAMVVEMTPAAAAEPKQKGPVVRLAEFLPEPPAGVPQFQPSMFDLPSGQGDSQGFCFNMSGLPMPPLMPGSDGAAGFATGIDGMTAPACPPQYPMDGQQQWQQQFQPQQLFQPQQQQQQQQLFQPQMHMTAEMQHQQQQQQQQQQMPPQQMQQEMQMQPPQPQHQPEMMQTQMQQIQMQMQQMQPPSMQPPSMQMQQMQMQPQMQMQSPQMQPMQPPQMQPMQMQQQPPMHAPQMQPPLMQPPQMQPPQLPQLQAPGPPQMQPDNIFLQQLMQMHMGQPQMQPPSWPPLHSPSAIAGEHLPAPPLQTAMEAALPSVLCPPACHHANVCRCGDVKLGDSTASAMGGRWADADGSRDEPHQQPNRLTLSAAMFPEMGTNAGFPTGNAGRIAM